MDVHAAIGGERTIRRVMALLVAFAALAERAAGRSLAVRFFVLWILRRAETVAEAFVFEQAGVPPVLAGIAAAGNDPDDALRLAMRFRALAAALGALLPAGWRYGRRPARRFACNAPERGSSRHPGGWTREPYDTS